MPLSSEIYPFGTARVAFEWVLKIGLFTCVVKRVEKRRRFFQEISGHRDWRSSELSLSLACAYKVGIGSRAGRGEEGDFFARGNCHSLISLSTRKGPDTAVDRQKLTDVSIREPCSFSFASSSPHKTDTAGTSAPFARTRRGLSPDSAEPEL